MFSPFAEVLGDAESVDVQAFTISSGKPFKLAKTSGRVVRRWEKLDLALLKIADPPASLVPLPLATAVPSLREGLRPGESGSRRGIAGAEDV